MPWSALMIRRRSARVRGGSRRRCGRRECREGRSLRQWGEGHSSSRDVVVYPCVVASVDAHACVAVRCGAVLKRKRRVAFESHCFRAAHLQLDPAIAGVCRDRTGRRRRERTNLRFAHILRSSAALAALTGGSQCQRCLGLCRVGVGVGARGDFLRRGSEGALMYVCSPGTDLIVCAVGCRWAT